MTGAIEDHVRQVTAAINGGVQKFLASVADSADLIRANLRARAAAYSVLIACTPQLAREGWFISAYFGLSELDGIAKCAASNDHGAVAAILAKLYSENLRVHLGDIAREYPERNFAIRPAVDAHLRGEYALSVPLFFAQAEGICIDRVQAALFHGKKEEQVAHVAKAELAEFVALNKFSPLGVDLVYQAMWASISDKLPIAYNPGERERFSYSGLNRNTVLHGIALEEYATEENSLKAFSLLSCIAALMPKK